MKKNISVLGIGKSGISAAILAKKKGYLPFISDSAICEKLNKQIHILNKNKIPFECGRHSERLYDADELILSPGIPKETKIVQSFFRKGKSVISEIEFSSRYTKQPIIAITGTNGKTTTTTLLGRMLEAEFSGKRLAGNIGIPLADIVSTNDENPIAVELSSFQLETIHKVKPKTTLWLNVSPNHLDWYNSYDSYIEAKTRINLNNDENTNVVYNCDDATVSEKSKTAKGNKYGFSLHKTDCAAFISEEIITLKLDKKIKLIKKEELQCSGPHHLMNIMASSLAAYLNHVSLENIRRVLKAFNGLEHRMEMVSIVNGVTYINDSKATSIDALKMALLSFDENILLITGGKHKGASYLPLTEFIRKNAKFVATIGSSGKQMLEEWKSVKRIENCETLERAINRVVEIAKKGDTVLFSPACSSFDQFKNFETRGKKFKQLVHEIEKNYE